MFLGIRSKSRKSVTVEVDYLIHVQEIKPWPFSQSQKSAQFVFLQWENGDQAYGSLTSGVGHGKIEFTESFRLPVMLCKEASRKGQARESYQKNNLEFYLYEPRKDQAMKGQLLGSAVINLADYGIIKETISVTAPMNCKKSSKNSGQPVLYINIQPFSNDSSGSSPKGSLSKEASLDNDGTESVSEALVDGNDEEAEIASFTDDDVDNGASSHSSRTINSSAFKTGVSSTPTSVKIEHEKTKDEVERNVGEPGITSRAEPADTGSSPQAKTMHPRNESSTYLSSIGSYSNHRNPPNDNVAFPYNPQDRSVPILKKSVTYAVRSSSSSLGYQDDPNKAINKRVIDGSHQIPKYSQESSKDNIVANLKHKLASSSMYSQEGEKRNHKDSQVTQEDDRDVWRQTEDGQEASTNNYSSTYSSRDISVPRSIVKSNKLKHVNSVQLPSETAKKNTPLVLDNMEFIEKPKRAELTKDTHDGGMTNALGVEKDIKNSFSDSKGELKAEIETLKEELREAAAVEVGLYSVVAEHGSSTNKIHAPARRISRFYFHACKESSPSKKANAARAAVSGFILVSKACGNDVPRLTFWLSNSIMLRAIISQTDGELSGGLGVDYGGGLEQNGFSPHKEEKIDKRENFDDWNGHQTFLTALEKFESWIFSRIVESVWWQTMTPHMQPAVAKGSSSRKAPGGKRGFGDHEQGNFSIELWKKAFKDACQRLCPSRADGHECGCLPVLARLVMEQLVDRLDVAMFNAILRENGEEMPTDPVSDPISDSKVLPIPAGRSSFGAGAQLKNAIGSWSRCLADMLDIDDAPGDKNELNDEEKPESQTSFKAFRLLNALSDLMMIPFKMLADKSTRKEVCPALGPPLIRMVLYNFVPDEFCPNPIPEAVFEALDSEDDFEVDGESVASFPCTANPTVYTPSAASLKRIIGEVGSQTLLRSGSSVLRKSYTSDDELNELDSPITSIIKDNFLKKRKGDRQVVRYQLLHEVWKDSE